ncbi:efflux RND transporter periplasmic adaptor subunit [Clostridium beijerinckii]|uniref:Multidrug efflux pump subunit AcrA (Membrane-fusion protein) n=1 Tax=Clostridium beijerinckii TaxID=1520 RepID=A0A9Q5CIN7_CLOBE|nr:efflux RND transporter periplasmic adaptor subunit [Clostridium beijerinckii]AQS04151.1 cobalt-zinc-cadmium resistance protein CzcB [Clostridium beijerinckii]MBA2883962.1 multidrug efflux pump subunit AcrA (membrane-fusion protein) [Clostridium beijerinckii]MBA2899146.1 multidrug efflux pump subunit AcrA (membrane-fusion protein) [Clostridium beijerinckii]MBA2908548.1 multidrug efflux pump subunit AcrA (membrane-fusion protein) [Clostridium beijerinckii]MBA9016300.1 multidrug efflux pump su
MKKAKKRVIYAVIIVAVIGGAMVVKNKMQSSSKNTTTTAATATKTSVDVKEAKTEDKTLGDIYKATLEAYQQGIITSNTSAKVLTVSIENGQYVNQGDTIATLDDQDIQKNIKSAQSQVEQYEQQINVQEKSLNSAQVSMESLQINVDDAQRNYDREKALLDKKAISQTDLESYEKTLNTAKASYNSGLASIETAKANLESAKASLESQKVTLANYQTDLNNTIIKAPISGVVSDKSLYVGQMASSGSTIAKINDISSVYATIQVPQEKISSIKIGQAATITFDGSDRTYDGTVQNINLSADTTARVFNVKVQIDNSDKSLLPGVYAKVELASAEATQVITVPVNALVGNEGDYSVFINDNGTAKKTKITIGETNGNNVEVASGIKDGDQIICSNTSTLQDGTEISVVTNEDSSIEDSASK